jgi:predicted O-linked N-acetylglucosamine transferase (SPINDLY family)
VVDGMLTSEELDPIGTPSGYSEKIVRLPGPVQRFGFPGTEDVTKARSKAVRSKVRLLHDLPPRATIYVSGAMVQKIGSDLLDAFLRVLQEIEDSVLVLYPFAPNWLTRFSPAAFRRIVAAALAARNLHPSRIRILDPLSREAVADLLACADVYLDSFPYAGATTVVEALEQRCPIVALEGATQRSRQGAAWVRQAGLAHHVASSVDEYVEDAIRLGQSKELRTSARTAIGAYLANGPVHNGSAEFAKMFADRLLVLAADSGLPLAPELMPDRFL